MGEDNGAAVGEEGVFEGDGRIKVLPDEKVAMIECRSNDSQQELVRLRGWRKNVVQCESMIILGRGDGD